MKTQIQIVPYRGNGPAVTDLLSGPRRLVVACNFGGTDAAALPAGEVEGGSVLIENCDEHRIQDGTLVLGPWCAVAFAW